MLGAASFVFLGVLTVASAQQPTGHTMDSLDVVKKNLKDGKAILIDVREQAEWDDGHLEGARFVPLSKLKKKDAAAEELIKLLPKDKTIYVHCASGRRVLVCGELLKGKGLDVRPLKSGYMQLLEAGFEKAPEKK